MDGLDKIALLGAILLAHGMTEPNILTGTIGVIIIGFAAYGVIKQNH